MDCGNGIAQRQLPATAGEDRERVKARRLRRRRLQIQLQHAAVGYAVVTGGVNPVDQGADVVKTGQSWQ